MRTVLATLVVMLLACSTAWGQCACSTPAVVQYGALSPVVAPAQTVTYQPIAPAPTVTYRPVAPAPTVTYRPVAAPVVTYRPVAPAPTVVYRTPVTTYYTPAPVTTYYAPAPAVTYSPVYPAAVVRTKVYYPGQPIRNFFKAITP